MSLLKIAFLTLKLDDDLFIWLLWVSVVSSGIFFSAAVGRIFSCIMRTLSCAVWDLVP